MTHDELVAKMDKAYEAMKSASTWVEMNKQLDLVKYIGGALLSRIAAKEFKG